MALDTHVVVGLYQDGAVAVPDEVAARLEQEQVRIAPPVQLEMAFLREIGRLTVEPSMIIDHLSSRLDVGREDISADALFRAHASALGVDLVTKDLHIHDHHPGAIW